MSHDSQLLPDMSKGFEPCKGNCRNQEDAGFCIDSRELLESALEEANRKCRDWVIFLN